MTGSNPVFSTTLRGFQYILRAFFVLFVFYSLFTETFDVLIMYWGVIRAHQSITLNMKAAEELNSGNPTKCLWEYASELVHDEYRRTMSDINVHPPISHHQGK